VDAGVVSQLQGCDEKVALTDAEVHRLARKPYFVGGIGEMRFLPGTRRHEARLLAADVDPGWPAEAEERQPGGDPVDTHLVRDAVEIDVAGSGDREVEVGLAVMLVVRVVPDVPPAGQVIVTGAEDRLVRIDHAVRQRPERKARLDGRARGVL